MPTSITTAPGLTHSPGISPGLPAATLARLQEHLTLLPLPTPVNLNTASAEVIWAGTPKLTWAQAEQLVQWRSARPLQSLDEASRALDVPKDTFNSAHHAVASQYFEVRARLRLGEVTVGERAILMRQRTHVQVLWRERADLD